MNKLPPEFYDRDDVVQIAKDLLGKIVVTNFDGLITSCRIVETEAYMAFIDRAAHSFGGRRTQRNEHMYAAAGTSYVYTCYGIHQLFNVVTNKKEVPDAVLIRAVEPLQGVDIMLHRSGKATADSSLTKGPGNLTRALGIQKIHSGISLTGNTIYIAEDNWPGNDLMRNDVTGSSKRIGIDGAGVDALLPYRFFIKGNKYVSARPVT